MVLLLDYVVVAIVTTKAATENRVLINERMGDTV